jgi:hypothetical protein
MYNVKFQNAYTKLPLFKLLIKDTLFAYVM